MKKQMFSEPDVMPEREDGIDFVSSTAGIDFVSEFGQEASYGQFLASPADNFDSFSDQRPSEIFLG